MNTPIKGRIICYRTELERRVGAEPRLVMDISEHETGKVETVECRFSDAGNFPPGTFVKVHDQGFAFPKITTFTPPSDYSGVHMLTPTSTEILDDLQLNGGCHFREVDEVYPPKGDMNGFVTTVVKRVSDDTYWAVIWQPLYDDLGDMTGDMLSADDQVSVIPVYPAADSFTIHAPEVVI